MKVIKVLSFLLFLAALQVSCNQKPKEQKVGYQVPYANYAQTLTAKDTADVRGVVVQFMDYAKKGAYEEAAALLYKPDAKNVWNEPMPLDNEELHRIADFLKDHPFSFYSVENIKFVSPVDTDVKCIMKIKEGEQEIRRNIHFMPINYLGDWRLCLME